MRLNENDIVSLIESVVRRVGLINEDLMSKAQNRAKDTLRNLFNENHDFRDHMAYMMDYAIGDPAVEENQELKEYLQQLSSQYKATRNNEILVEFWYEQFRGSIPNMRTKAVYFLPGCIMLYANGQLTNATRFSAIGRIAQYLMSLNDRGGYNSYFSREPDYNKPESRIPVSYLELVRETANARKELSRREREDNENDTYDDNQDYDVVLIKDQQEAQRYGQYTNWCICHNRAQWDQYTNDGNYTVYFMLRNGYQNVEREAEKNYPFDEYGLSMISVVVFPDGNLACSTSRWNEGKKPGDIAKITKRSPDLLFMPKELGHLVGKNFFSVFKPVNEGKNVGHYYYELYGEYNNDY